MESIAYLGETIRKWTIGASTFIAWPEKGARLMNWNVQLADRSVRDVIHWPDSATLRNFAKVRGGNPILFPFCGRTFARGTEDCWLLKRSGRPMPRHGFCRGGGFGLEEITPHGFAALFQPDEESKKAYPFNYRFQVLYRFRELSLAVELRLSNLDGEAIPWCAGHHFYFHLPWHEGAKRADYLIDLPARKAFLHGPGGGLERVSRFNPVSSFDDPSLLDRIHTGLKRNPVSFGPKSGEENIGIYLGSGPVPEKDFAVVTWTEAPDSPFYCVEPWMGPPNSPEHKKGLRWVEPGKTDTFSVEVALL